MHKIDFPYGSVYLNDEQYRVVVADPFQSQRILASAGSGKTTTITARISWLIDVCNVDPSEIVLLTFSRNAAQEMRHRVYQNVGPVQLWAGTFHALAKNVLYENDPAYLPSMYFVDELPVKWFTWMHSEKGRQWVGKIRYVVVDEFQDINNIQWRLLEALRHPGVRTIIVGDDAQNIYTWRGSSTSYLLDYHKTVKRVCDYQLRMNYRSSEAIVSVANSVMRHIPTLPWKEKMVAHKKGGSRPEVLFFWKFADEITWICKMIDIIKIQQPQFTVAVLGRNNMDLYRAEEVFLQYGMDCTLYSADSGGGHNGGDVKKVALCTFHGSKGLEWDVVFCICCNDDALPSRKSAEHIVGERRLFYVAVTRARQKLYFTYHGNERKLTRFIREVHSKLLTYHGLAKYSLSDVEIGSNVLSLQHLLDGLDGDDWNTIRNMGLLEDQSDAILMKQILPYGESWTHPGWCDGEEFSYFVRLFIKRLFYIHKGGDESYHDHKIERLLFCLRIYNEDRPFWELYHIEIDAMVRYFFHDTYNLPPAEYVDVEAWAEKHNVSWTSMEVVKALTILSKIRGQLRPIRFEPYSFDEFTICPSVSMIPTEYRLETLRSWRKFQNKTLGWKVVLEDIWRLSCMDGVDKGRNACLFRIPAIKHKFSMMMPYLETLETYIVKLLDGIENEEIYLNPTIVLDEFAPIESDVLLGNVLLRIVGEKKVDMYTWVETCLQAYLFHSDHKIDVIQLFHPYNGLLYSLEIREKSYKELFDTLVLFYEKKMVGEYDAPI